MVYLEPPGFKGGKTGPKPHHQGLYDENRVGRYVLRFRRCRSSKAVRAKATKRGEGRRGF